MKPGGVLLVIAGVWVLCQVLGGNMLARLGIEASAPADDPTAEFGAVPDKGHAGVPHNAQGDPL